MTDPGVPDSNRVVAANSVKIMVAQGLGVAIGLGYDIAIAALFGATRQMDSIFAAITIPQIFASVMISISLRVFTPVFTEAMEHGGKSRLRTVFSGVFNFSLIFWVLVGMVGFLGAQLIILLQTPGFEAEPRSLSVYAFRILLLNMVLIGMVEPIRAYLVYRQYLVLASLANFFRFSAALIVLLLISGRFEIRAVPWAYVAGGAAQLIIFGTAFVWIGGRYRITLGRSEGTWEIIRSRFGPPLVGEVIGQSGVIIERMLASFLPPGVLSALGYGRRILVALNGVINQSVSVAILPRISREAVAKQLNNLRQSILFSTKLLTLGTGLTAVIIFGFSPVLVTVLLQRGAFDTAAAELTGTILRLYIPSIIFIGISQLFMIPFFAYGETKIVRNLRIIFLAVNLTLDLILFRSFGGFGLAAAFTLTTILNSVLAYHSLARRIGSLRVQLAPFVIKLPIVILLVGLLILFGSRLIDGSEPGLTFIILNALLMGLATALYLGLILLFGMIQSGSIRS